MNLKVVRYDELAARHLERWRHLQASEPALASPCFHPHFVQAVAESSGEVFVAVIEDGAGFFPFQRSRWAIGRPVGTPLSDYHGVIAGAEYSGSIRDLVRSCGLSAWDFDHVPAAQVAFDPWAHSRTESPIVDLTRAAAVGSAKLRTDAANRRRKLEREIGSIEFEMQSADVAALEQLFAWKSAQYRETGERDLFSTPWIRTMIEKIRQQNAPEFSGWLSVLRAGGQPVAAHFGMRSRGLLHYWFPAYDSALSTYSPGILLLLAMIDAMPAHALSSIDFGKGDAFYKKRLANSAIPLLEGSVIAAPWLASFRTIRTGTEAWIRRGPLLRPARAAAQWLRGRQQRGAG
ncbi:MAG TPA: GNAT family N-acetyltransferase [Chthoniobacteraceae bacterium]|jgi:CelD/BcsL family acetyltransferase involved in cellulose biosynthesis